MRYLLFLISSLLIVFSSSLLSAKPVATIDPSSGLRFIAIPAGSFNMGTSNLAEAAADMPVPNPGHIKDESPLHKVTFTSSFLMSATEVTQDVWLKVMGTKPGPNSQWEQNNWRELPVVSVSWNDTQRFITKLNSLSKQYQYRLPTESEWEYVARSGDHSLRPFSLLAMDESAWYIHNSNDEVQPVATLDVNPWGIYDMHGNVWEWVSDWYQSDSYSTNDTINPTGPQFGRLKVRRGGSFHCQPHLIRPGYRDADKPDNAYSVLGFRLVAMSRQHD